MPSDQVALLINAGLPSSDHLFPSDLFTTAVEKKHLAAQDTLIQRAIASERIPLISSRAVMSLGTVAEISGATLGAHRIPLLSLLLLVRRRDRRNPVTFLVPPSSSLCVEVEEKDEEADHGKPSKSLSRVNDCLSIHWMD